MNIKEFIKKFLKSSLLKSASIILSGTVIAQILNFIFQVFVTRIYTVEEYGDFAVYVSILTITSVLVCLGYEHAIVTHKEESEIHSLFTGVFFISLISSIILFGIIFIFNSKIQTFLEISSGGWLYLLPLNTFLLSLYNSLISCSYTKGSYKTIGFIECLRTIVLGIIQILFGLQSFGIYGLILGRLVSIFVCVLVLLVKLFKDGYNFKNISHKKVTNLLKKDYRFPLFQLPASFVNHFLDTVITFVIISLYSNVELGYYSLVVQILSLPISLISTTLRTLLISEFNNKDYSESRNIYLKVGGCLFFIITIPMVIAFFFGENIFAFVFGQKWLGSGFYIKALIPLYIMKFVAYPLSSVAVVTNKQKVLLIFQISLILTTLGVFIISKGLEVSSSIFFLIMSFSLSFVYSIQIFVYYNILKRRT